MSWDNLPWIEILARLGIDRRFLKNQHGPCPICGGKDRFRWDNWRNRGTWICNRCGAGGPSALIAAKRGLTRSQAFREIRDVLRTLGFQDHNELSKPKPPGRSVARKVWERAGVIDSAGLVAGYLTSRGLGRSLKMVSESCLREDLERRIMVAAMRDIQGSLVCCHQTFLTAAGHKIPGTARKFTPLGENETLIGTTAQLFDSIVETLAIAEGIETALAVYLLTGYPTWAALNAGNLARVVIPDAVRELRIYADHDRNFVGQAAAYALAKRYSVRGCNVIVQTPRCEGDWADVLTGKRGKTNAGS